MRSRLPTFALVFHNMAGFLSSGSLVSNRRAAEWITIHPRQLQAVSGWDKTPVRFVRGSSHLRYETRGEYLRLLTNMPLTYFCEETPVVLTSKIYSH